MNTTAVLIALLILVLVILAGNTMIAVAFLKNRKGNFRGTRGRDQDSIDELHRQIQNLPRKKS